MSKSDYLENKVLDHILGATAYSAPGTVYVSLHSADPTDAGNGAELSGNGYARKSVTNNTTNWPNASSGSKSNGTAITFATATGNWTAATHFGIWDASSAGNLLYFGALTASKTVQNGDTASFAVGALTITED